MRDRLDPQRSHLVQILYLYMQALESSDIEMVARIMSQAEQDATLERMLLEINEVYQEADTSSISSGETEYIQDFLLPFIDQEAPNQLNGARMPLRQKPGGILAQLHAQESEQHRMKDIIETTQPDTSTEQPPLPGEGQRPVYHSTRKRRLAHFMQMFAAVMVTGLLLSGFLLLLSSRHSIPGRPSTGETSKSASIV